MNAEIWKNNLSFKNYEEEEIRRRHGRDEEKKEKERKKSTRDCINYNHYS